MLRECLVVDERILGKDRDSLADVEVQTCLILGSLHVALAVRLIHVVTRLHVDTAVLWQLSQWGNDQSIYTLCLVADFCIQIAGLGVGIVEVGDALGKSLAGRVDILRTYSPAVFLVFEREGVAVLVQAAGTAECLFYRFSFLVKNRISSSIFLVDNVSLFIVVPGSLSCIRTGPSEGTDAHAAYRHYPYTTNHILLLVNVLGIGSLSVEYTNLIVQQVSAVGILEKIALELKTDVTAVGCMFSGTVAETSQLAHVL